MDIINDDTFIRPMYASSIISKMQSYDTPKVLSIRSGDFFTNDISTTNANVNIENFIFECTDEPKAIVRHFRYFFIIMYIFHIIYIRPQLLSNKVSKKSNSDLATANIVLAGGRGFKTKESFQLIYKLAEKLDAAVGVTKAAVDLEYGPYEL